MAARLAELSIAARFDSLDMKGQRIRVALAKPFLWCATRILKHRLRIYFDCENAGKRR